MFEAVTVNFIKNKFSGEFISVGVAHFDGKFLRLATNLNKVQDLDGFESIKTSALTILRDLKRQCDYSNKCLSDNIQLMRVKKDNENLRFGSVFLTAGEDVEKDFLDVSTKILGQFKRIDLYSSKDFVVCECLPLQRIEQPNWTSHHKECKHYDPQADLLKCIEALTEDMDQIELAYKINVSQYFSYQKAKFILTGLFPKLKGEK